MGESPTKRHRKWMTLLQDAVKADGWGQVLEAVEAYEKAAGAILQDLPEMELNEVQHDIVEKIVVTLNLRTTSLSSIDGNPRPNKEDMELLVQVLDGILIKSKQVFPLDLAEFDDNGQNYPPRAERAIPVPHVKDSPHSEPIEMVPSRLKEASAASMSDFTTYLTITIHKIGLKDVDRYIDPQILISVVDKDLVVVEEKQETCIATMRDSPYIFFETSVALRTSLQVLQQNDSTIFFEFVHYKKSKRKKSCRCWTMIEIDEIKQGSLALELYTKPCDFSKTQINLFTIKPLYLHVDIRLEEN